MRPGARVAGQPGPVCRSLAWLVRRAAALTRYRDGAELVGKIKRSPLVHRLLYTALGDETPPCCPSRTRPSPPGPLHGGPGGRAAQRPVAVAALGLLTRHCTLTHLHATARRDLESHMALRKSVPKSLQVLGRRAYLALGEPTAGLRVKPDFIMIGAQRCGTTSLFRALMEHPQSCARPSTRASTTSTSTTTAGQPGTGGALPDSVTARTRTASHGRAHGLRGQRLLHVPPDGARADGQGLPDVKLVAMLRDPVERAYSA